MPLVLKDRVRETSTTTGTGSFTLAGALAGFQSFSVIGNANTTYYGIVNPTANEWEIGIGTYTASGTVLSRDTILESSNSGAAVNFSAGTKDVFVTYPAEKAASLDTFSEPPVIGNTTPNAATFTTLTATGQTSLGGAAGSESLRVLTPTTAGNYLQINTSSGGDIIARNEGSGTNITTFYTTKGTGPHRFGTAGSITNEQLRVSHTASAVNFVQVTGAATTGFSTISAQGSDTNTGLYFQAKGTGQHRFSTGGANSNEQFRISHTASAVNYAAVTGAAAGAAPVISVAGNDTNIDLALTPKGTGLVRFGTRTASADAAITGYIEIKDSGGTTRRLAVIG